MFHYVNGEFTAVASPSRSLEYFHESVQSNFTLWSCELLSRRFPPCTSRCISSQTPAQVNDFGVTEYVLGSVFGGHKRPTVGPVAVIHFSVGGSNLRCVCFQQFNGTLRLVLDWRRVVALGCSIDPRGTRYVLSVLHTRATSCPRSGPSLQFVLDRFRAFWC